MPDYIIYSDGGARGNPGPAAYGYTVRDAQGNVLTEAGVAIGATTNNVAEYMGPLEGLKALRAKLGKTKAKVAHVEVRMDSELVIKQMNREYRIRGEHLIPLFIELWNRCVDFASVTFVHVRREQNKDADRLVNEALNEKGEGSLFT